MTDATAALAPSPDVAALEGLPENEIDAAVGIAWQSFGRRTVVDAWHLGTALARVKNGRGRHFAAYCEGIGMSRSWSYDLLKLAGGPLEKVSGQRTISGALKALGPKRIAQESPVEPTNPLLTTVEQESPVESDDVLDVVAEEEEPTPDELRDEREARIETFAMKTQDIEGDLVDGWMAKYEEQEARHKEHDRITHQRHRTDVQIINAGRRAIAAERRKNRDVCDALLASPGCATCDEVLARFFAVQRRPAA